MDVSERCERLARCRAKFQDIADRGADVIVQYVVREHWHIVSGDPHRARFFVCGIAVFPQLYFLPLVVSSHLPPVAAGNRIPARLFVC
jgi:hypothetical protein